MNKRRRYKAKARRRALVLYARFCQSMWRELMAEAERSAAPVFIGVDLSSGESWTVTMEE